MQVAELLLVLQFLLSNFPAVGQVEFDVILDFVYPSLDLHHLDFQFFLQLYSLALQIVNHLGINVALYHGLFDLVHDP